MCQKRIWVYEERRGRRKQPYAVRTPLGWTLIGRLNSSSAAKEAQVHFVRGSQEMLSSQLKRMYGAEFSECLASSKLAMSGEDRRALTILENSAPLVDGHYQLALPWRYRPPSLKKNRYVALASSPRKEISEGFVLDGEILQDHERVHREGLCQESPR